MTKPGIYWTKPWNPIIGCGGCSSAGPHGERCWAPEIMGRFRADAPDVQGIIEKVAGRFCWTGLVRFREEVLEAPLYWRKPRVIATCWMGDIGYALEKAMVHQVARIFGVMAYARQHTYLLLSKRPANLATTLNAARFREVAAIEHEELEERHTNREGIQEMPWPPPNIWLGTSAENQAALDERLPELLRCGPGWRYWASLEPCLGPMDLRAYLIPQSVREGYAEVQRRYPPDPAILIPAHLQVRSSLLGVVLGAETGPGARPMELDWARQVRDQCAAAGVPFYLKSLGPGKRRILDGREHNEVPWKGEPCRNSITMR